MDSELRTAFLISGGGSTAESIIKAEIPRLRPVAVISSEYGVKGIERADALGIPTYVMSREDFETREQWSDYLLRLLQSLKVDLVSQNGWMPLTPKNIVETYQDWIINQHPGALDPGREYDFGGKGMHGPRVSCAVLAYNMLAGIEAPTTEATVHMVTENYDEGELISIAELEIPGFDGAFTYDELWERRENLMKMTDQVSSDLLPLEHKNAIDALTMFTEGPVESYKRDSPLIADDNIEHLVNAKRLTKNIFKES